MNETWEGNWTFEEKPKRFQKARRKLTQAKNLATGAAESVRERVRQQELPKISVESLVRQSMKVPLVHVNREEFLRKELLMYYPESVVQEAIRHNPATAGIGRDVIDEIAKRVINYETNKVSAMSFAVSVPGALAMPVSLSADLAQYYGFVIRVMQKLAYLYGFPAFEFGEKTVSDELMNQVMVFLAVMMGIEGSNRLIKLMAYESADLLGQKVLEKAVAKGLFPVVRRLLKIINIKLTQELFSKTVSKAVPLVGGAVSGALTYRAFKSGAKRLQKRLRELYLSDPGFYRNMRNDVTGEMREEFVHRYEQLTGEIIMDAEYRELNE